MAAQLIGALGFNTPPVVLARARFDDFWLGEGTPSDALALVKASAVTADGYYRLAAVAWPAGNDLGPAPEAGRRQDDPNDLIDHEDRRSLRALAVFASWLALSGLGPSKMVDRYSGPPGAGHVVHYLAGLDAALGASKVVRTNDTTSRVYSGGSPFIRLLTLGLARNPPPPLTQVAVPAIGGLSASLDPARFDLAPPFAPAVRLQAADGYWAARQIAELIPTHLALAIEAGKFSDLCAQEMLQRALTSRARALLAYWFARVVPLRLLSFTGTWLALQDEAVALGLVDRGNTEYRLDFLDGEANVVAPPIDLHPANDHLELALPPAALEVARDYLVVRITAQRRRRWLPRAFEVHIRPVNDALAVVGLRH